jgi:peptidoglycan/LPS O-acetylase OafA/YrhL
MTKYRADIDALRAIAILEVLFYHADFSWMPGGYVGVDVFFVISGYLISGLISREIAQTESFNFRHFYIRRARRLFPALFAVIAATFVFGAFVLTPEYLTYMSESVLASIFSCANFFFFEGSNYFEIGKQVRPLLHTWSLGVEEQFYLVWPLLLWIILRHGRVAYSITILTVFVASFCAGLTLFLHPSAVFYLLPFRVWEFALGAAVALCGSAKDRRWLNDVAYAAGAALVVGSAVFLTKDSLYPFYNALAPCCGAALMIYSGNASRIAAPFKKAPVIAIGKISYSLYLVHWPIIVYYKYLVEGDLRIEEQLILIAVTIFTAMLLYFTIEKKFRYVRGSSNLGLKPVAVAVALASIALVCTPATSAMMSGGWLWRYPDDIRLMLAKAGNDISIPHPLNGCFKLPAAERADIRESCYAPMPGDPRPSVILVGDSTAYALAAGLQATLGNDYQVLVWTSAVCAALYGTEFPPQFGKCQKNNTEFFERIVHQYKYDLVIFSNNSSWPWITADFHRGAEILDQIKLDYVLLGQMITYRDIPLSIMARYGLGNLNEIMRQKMLFGCDEEYGLDKLVPENHFFSMHNILCKNGYPMYSINGSILQVDTLHLTDAGAMFVSEKLKSWLLKNDHLHPK